MRPLSLKIRVTLSTVVIIAVVITAISAVAYHELEEALAEAHDPMLSAVAAAMRSRIGGLSSQPTSADVEALLKRTPSTDAVELLVWSPRAGNVQLHCSPDIKNANEWIAQLDPARRPEPGNVRMLTLTHGKHEYRAAWFRYRLADDTLSALVITSLRHANHELSEFLRMLMILGISMLLAAGVLAAASVLLTMRPIRTTAKRLAHVTYKNLGAEHLAGVRTPVELQPFVDSVGEMLVRVNQGAQQQKRFVAEASHELRTPLALAKSTIQATRLKERTSQEYRQTLDELLADIDRMNHLVGQLLNLARLEETGRDATEDVDLSELLRSLADQHEPEAAAAGNRIICNCPDVPLTVKASPVELESLFGNLIDNAVKHGPNGGTINVCATANDDNCVVTVHDEGGLIPADQIDRLFGRFYRADASRSRATGGSGLGLAIARQIVVRHSGDIRITSTPTEGTTVSVRLPLANLA